MENLSKKLNKLLESNSWSNDDRKWLLEYLENNDTEELQQIMQQLFKLEIESHDETQTENAKILLEEIQQKIRLKLKPAKLIRLTLWRGVAAAVIILMFGIGSYYMFFTKRLSEVAVNQNSPLTNDALPGGNKAVLELADGSKIILDNAKKGALTQQGNISVLKLDEGKIAYNTLQKKSAKLLYNTITTPRGGQYLLILQDGSKVWLNAASSIRFPVAFLGKERKVDVTGEAYFEVTKNKNMPFRVAMNDMNVEVLGTHFNINAYADEASIKTTLLEGKVKVSRGTIVQMLLPGQQAQAIANGQIVLNTNADIEEVIAWKNGYFSFNGADIQTIMRQVSKWYDVEVIYENGIPSGHYRGKISRNVNASEMLKVLEESGIHFRIEDKKIIIKQ
jgi:ferric-dicitrate binding protein FerR (iron transport regulator)